MMRTIECTCLIFLLHFTSVTGLYFTITHQEVFIHVSQNSTTPADLLVTEVYVHSAPSAEHLNVSSAFIVCHLVSVERVRDSANRVTSVPHFMASINDKQKLRVTLARNTAVLDTAGNSKAVEYRVQVRCVDKRREENSMYITVHLHNDIEQMSPACTVQRFQVVENIAGVSLGRVWIRGDQQDQQLAIRLISAQGLNSSRSYMTHLSLIDSSGHTELFVSHSLDRETDSQVLLNFSLVGGGKEGLEKGAELSLVCQILLEVIDTNDVGPWFIVQNAPMTKQSQSPPAIPDTSKDLLQSLVITDWDEGRSNQYRVKLEDDYLNLLSLDPLIKFSSSAPFYHTSLKLKKSKVISRALNYTVKVIFEDLTYIPFNISDSSKASYLVTLTFQTVSSVDLDLEVQVVTVNVSTLASRYYVIYELNMNTNRSELNPSHNHSYHLSTRTSQPSRITRSVHHSTGLAPLANGRVSEAFAVTPTEGLVYINSTTALRNLSDSTVTLMLEVVWSYQNSSGTFSNKTVAANITVNVVNESFWDSELTQEADMFCALHKMADDCERSRGIGSGSGLCVWRRSNNASINEATGDYETCSPSLERCPDLSCDALERIVPELCPQDCTGISFLNTRYAPNRGILRAVSPCYCNKPDYCTCQPPPPISNYTLPTTTRARAVGLLMSAEDFCGTFCRVWVGLAVGGAILIGSGAVCLCFLHRRRLSTKKGGASARVGFSLVSSQYYESGSTGAAAFSYDSSGQQLLYHTTAEGGVGVIMLDTERFLAAASDLASVTREMLEKWEFPREGLTLGEVLGEGQFGKVVKAEALNISSKPGNTVVAVKMLKECAGAAEFRDLLSEFSLLQQVNHRNLVHLLAVSSKSGPFYIIVEYCKYGSLKSLLRACRGQLYSSKLSEEEELLKKDTPMIIYEEQKSLLINEKSSDVIICGQDLLSFSWQIAKGMEYLSDMKIIHRDLAARNILVDEGKVIKISDFGLSRDVYMEDSYLKTSKGPLPVKWMAPESLYDQIYTSKSDVWSYGIVLWEISTFGANPYPGTPAERLYHLLKTGYRLERPPTCSIDLYTVMMQCWRDESNERPTFKQLSDIFEQFLCVDKEYLNPDLLPPITEDPVISSDLKISRQDQNDSQLIDKLLSHSLEFDDRPYRLPLN